MKYRGFGALLIALSLFLAAVPVFAHHSHNAEFDPSKTITLKGTITQVDWENPHIHVHLDVKDNSGKIVNWSFESYAPGVLHRAGITRETFKEGQVVTIAANPARDGTKDLAYLKEITYSDGHSIEIWLGDPSQYK